LIPRRQKGLSPLGPSPVNHDFYFLGRDLYCEKVPVCEIAGAVGTPVYIYSHKTLVEHYAKLTKAFRRVRHLICFSMKANSNLAILKALVSEGAGLDIVSGGELFRALRAGCGPRKIVYAGVGKTEVAKVLAKVMDAKLIRLQCYEGLDANTALYEWNYPKQMLRIKLEEVDHGDKEAVETEIFTGDYLIKRPLLEAIQSAEANPPVLLIDEIDRADMEFEAFLLEVLSDFQITIPEIGTISAKHRPYVFLTSNRTREIHDALKRRCLYHWIEYPSFEKEYEIITTKFPQVEANMARQICAFMQRVREMNFYKRPGVAETLDWASALIALNRKGLDDKTVVETMGCVFKYREDLHHLREQVEGKQLNLEALLRVSPEMLS